MVLRGSRVTKLHFIEVPVGIPVGIVVGPGGSQCQQLRAKHGVRCRADFNTRRVQVEGSREGVDAATREIHGWFDVWRADQDHNQQSTLTIRKVAVAMANENGASPTWRFEHRDAESLGADPSATDYDYRLVAMDPTPSDEYEEDENGDASSVHSRPWIFRFDASFRQQMRADVAALVAVDPSSPVKLKVTFSLQCFAIPDEQIANGKTHLWNELQSLQLRAQLKPRWSNVLSRKSNVLGDLLDELEHQFDEATTFKTELIIYLNKRYGRRDDVSIKYRWDRRAWVLVERKPMRVAHALYTIALDNDTAFRVRAYSRKAAPVSFGYEELVNSLEIATASAQDPFSTTVNAARSFPSQFHIRTFVVQETVTVTWRGLRFTISYMNAKRTHVSLVCRLSKEDNANALAPPEAMQSLLEKVLAITATE